MEDILDIDELTKDDSFFKDKDNDVCNIIQQWKNKQHQLQAQHLFQAPQQTSTENNDNAYRVNSRTFTRPKRKSTAQNLEPQFNGISEQQCQVAQYPLSLDTKFNAPMLNVQIGGKIRTPLSVRSMLHDTSPPSYMDASLGNSPMDNSLVTSADFTNIDFLLSTPSLDANTQDDKFNNHAGQPRYTLSDMICDRKALESLTLSGDDGTFIKDSQIAQFDDISLALFKASSGSSTMGNSTESVEGNSSGAGNATVVWTEGNHSNPFDFNDRTIEAQNITFTSSNGTGQSGILQQKMVLSNEEMISDTTYSLIENGQSFIIEKEEQECKENVNEAMVPQLNKTHNVIAAVDASPKIRASAWNETICKQNKYNEMESVKETPIADATFDFELPNLPGTPEEFRKPMKSISTPHNATRYTNLNTFLPSVNMISEDVNISPITHNEFAPSRLQASACTEPCNTTYGMNEPPAPSTVNSDTYIGSPLSHLNDEMEMLENIEMPNPNESHNHRRRSRTRLLSKEFEPSKQQQEQERLDLEQVRLNKSAIEMQDVMDLVEAEAELLAAADDGIEDDVNFEHILDELSRVELNAEQLKMKKSVETIKKRFNCTLNGASERECNTFTRGETASSKTFTNETREEALRNLRDEMSQNRINDVAKVFGNSSFSSDSTSSMATSNGSSCERLLSRRSRLYDDINLSTLAAPSDATHNHVEQSMSTINTTIAPVVQTTKTTTTLVAETAVTNEKTEGGESLETTKYKLTEKRERDRDRFKTIKIVKNANCDGDGSASQNELNVPCIDNEEVDENEMPNETTNTLQQRYSRRDLSNAEGGVRGALAAPRTVVSKLQSNTNFLTYKKPKYKQIATNTEATTKINRHEVVDIDHKITVPKVSSEVRSLSRPRYISGLQRCSVVSKAVSAGDLGKTDINTAAEPSSIANEEKTTQLTRLNANGRKLNGIENSRVANAAVKTPIASQASKSELKSPMGLKAKSLHNLSSNLNYTGFNTGIAAPSRIFSYGLRKINSGGINAVEQPNHQQQQHHPSQVQKSTNNLTRTTKVAIGSVQAQSNQATFKKPQRVSNLKNATIGSAGARITRPSSGYYSLNVVNKSVAQTLNSDDIKPSRSITALNDGKISNQVASVTDEPNQLTRVTVGATSIPKPSGLRAPTKRSGLPVPSSGVRR